MNPSTFGSAGEGHPFLPGFPYHLLTHTRKKRVAVFGSFYGGYHLLLELLGPELQANLDVVGVATDDPTQSFCNPARRLWRHPHSRDDELMVLRFAAGQGIPVYTGRINTESFVHMLSEQWDPDLCLMATFGQKIPSRIIQHPRLGFFNFHHSDDTWPSYPGATPIEDMIRDGKTHLVITMHEVNDVIDGGALVARSERIPIPKGVNSLEMHRISWPQMGPFIRAQVGLILDEPASLQDAIRPIVHWGLAIGGNTNPGRFEGNALFVPTSVEPSLWAGSANGPRVEDRLPLCSRGRTGPQ